MYTLLDETWIILPSTKSKWTLLLALNFDKCFSLIILSLILAPSSFGLNSPCRNHHHRLPVGNKSLWNWQNNNSAFIRTSSLNPLSIFLDPVLIPEAWRPIKMVVLQGGNETTCLYLSFAYQEALCWAARRKGFEVSGKCREYAVIYSPFVA